MKKTYLLNNIFLCLSFSGMMYAQEVTINKNLKIERDGTLVYTDSATVFDDQVVDLSRAKSKTNNLIVFDDVENTVKFSSTATWVDYIYVNVQISHQWKSGTAIYPHLHIEQTLDSLPNMLLQYRWQINGGAKTTTWINLKCKTPVFSYSTGTTLNQIIKTNPVSPPSGYSISDILQFRIMRDKNNSSGLFGVVDPLTTTDVHFLSFDFHYEKDTDGSRTQIAK